MTPAIQDATGVELHLVEDDEAMRSSVSRWLTLAGFTVHTHGRATALLPSLEYGAPAVVISDISMPGMSGLELQQALLKKDADLPVILFTGHGDIDMAVRAMRAGAYDFIEKPFDAERLLETVRRACEKRRLVLENRALQMQMQEIGGLHARLVGSSPAISHLKRQVLDAASVDANVLLVGETGTGKEVIARCLHDLSPRSQAPYVALNCAAIPATLAESELFGHEPGAFTSASQRRVGSLEQATEGTLFLDEVVSMPIDVQAKLLRVIEQREFCRLGSNRVRQANFRLVAAMNIEPREAMERGLLRNDLYYRFNILEFRIPPLRERKEDIPILFTMFAEQAAENYQRDMVYPDAGTVAALMGYDWPGNVRELKNVATRFILSPPAQGEPFIPFKAAASGVERPEIGLQEQVRAFERSLIEDALRRHNGNIRAVLEDLRLPRRTLNEKMQRYGLMREAAIQP
ncbi:DNA-binding response regulator [Alkalilimnicola ehrlichii]|uniref:DNA-binding response regulator n=1 Tax=Alkalilimnicola ehrlichii TaxID=351052 RepID=A0A3E0WUY4_9GAMM|nr:sigma-54 dependent transcriptional regulator [Alkalilimnicola ehrlichii]RFA29277.1 DNA-binding response regulator [Alkalilimnicola ehrlichii]RFA36794.1 DNA-binding response regulator [Alkalilimnicola ehrlichii]